MRGRLDRPRQPLGGGRGQKGGSGEPHDHALGRSRGGFGTKIHLATDGHGVPLTATVTPGQTHESTQLEPVLDAVRIGRRRRPKKLAGDKGYSYGRVRRYLHRRGIRPVIPRRSDQLGKPGPTARFDRDAYRRRNVIERCVGWLKENRRLGTRYEKLAMNFLAFVTLAMIRRCLRLLHS